MSVDTPIDGNLKPLKDSDGTPCALELSTGKYWLSLNIFFVPGGFENLFSFWDSAFLFLTVSGFSAELL